MLHDLFNLMNKTLDDIDETLSLANDFDQELILLEKYMEVKEVSEKLSNELAVLIRKIKDFERKHSLLDISIEDEEGKNNYDVTDEQEQDNLEEIIEIEEDDFLTFQRGIGYFDLSMFEQAIINLNKINKKYPDFNLARLYTAMTYFKEQKYEKAKKELIFMLQLTDNKDLIALGNNLLGIIASYLKDFDNAIKFYQRSINANSSWDEPLFNLGLVYYKLNLLDEAIRVFEQLYYKNQKDWEILFYLGKIYKKLKQYDLANEFFKQSYNITKNPKVIEQIANNFELKIQTKQTIYWYKRWLSKQPGNLKAMLGLAKNLWIYGDKESSQALVKKILSIDRENIDAVIVYAWILTDIDTTKTIFLLNKVVSLDKFKDVGSISLSNLSRLFYLNKDLDMALRFSDMLLESSQSQVQSLGRIVKGLISLDQLLPDQAIYHFERCINDFPYINYYLGYSHYLLGDNKKAEYYWNMKE